MTSPPALSLAGEGPRPRSLGRKQLKRAAFALLLATAAVPRTARADTVSRTAIERLGARGVEVISAASEGRSIRVLVEVPPDGSAEALGVRPIVPGIGVLEGSAARIAGFQKAHANWSVELSPPLHTKLDVAAPYVGAVKGRATSGLDGTGVYVGVVDTGIDIFHPDFRGSDGKTRVAWILDLSMAPREGNARDSAYGGRVFTRAEIDAILTGQKTKPAGPVAGAPDDVEGHGTHVAGVAAAGGGDSKKYVGVAPGADLVVVRTTRDRGGDIAEADAVLGAKFVYDMADLDQRPAVVNLSLGSQFGAHDGTSVFERGLTALVGNRPGRAMVVAASNEGALPIHTSGRVSPGVPFRIPIRLPGRDGRGAAYGSAQLYVWLNWRDGGDVSVGLEGPSRLPWIDSVPRGLAREATPASQVVAQIVNDVADTQTIPRGTHGAIITVRGPLPAGEYQLVLRGDGAVEAYLQGVGEAGDGRDGSAVFARGGQVEGSIGVPASAAGLIAVGCVGVRESFTDSRGKTYRVRGAKVGTRCGFSSAGPSATGALRPDVLAPGLLVVSSLARLVAAKPGPDLPPEQIIDSEHAAVAGTSVSAPFAAGAIALLFQRDPRLTQEQLRAALIAGARPLADDAPPASGREYGKGAGILDVEGALAALTRTDSSPPATQVLVRLSASYLDADAKRPLWAYALTRDADGRPADPSASLWLSVEGANVQTSLERVGTGYYRFAIVAAPHGGGGVATMRLGGALTASREIPIAADRWDALDRVAPVGGCAVARWGEWAGGAGAGSQGGGLYAGAVIAAFIGLRRSRSRGRASATAARRRRDLA